MMAREDLVLEARDAPDAPLSVRLAVKHGVRAPVTTDVADRRAHPRIPASELTGIRLARLKSGPDVTLVDLSTGGALLETEVHLRPGSVLSLEIAGPSTQIVVPFEVLRSHISRIVGSAPVYRGACAFTRPLDLSSLIGPPELAGTTPSQREFVGFEAAIDQVVETCAGTDPSAAPLSPREALEILRALRNRALKHRTEPFGRYLGSILTTVVQGLEANRPAASIVAAIESHVERIVVPATAAVRRGAGRPASDHAHAPLVSTDGADARLVRTADRLATLVKRLGTSNGRVATPTDVPRQATPAAPDSAAPAGWQKIVVRYIEGRILKGYTQDFHPSRAQLSLWPAINAPAQDRVVVPLSRLKAVFFVRDFGGNPDYVEQTSFEGPAHGRKIEVTFVDDEVVLGTTLNYRADGQGFFLIPADPRANNVRIFVVPTAVRHVRFP